MTVISILEDKRINSILLYPHFSFDRCFENENHFCDVVANNSSKFFICIAYPNTRISRIFSRITAIPRTYRPVPAYTEIIPQPSALAALEVQTIKIEEKYALTVRNPEKTLRIVAYTGWAKKSCPDTRAAFAVYI